MRYIVRTVTPPAELPLPFTVEEGKLHLRVTSGAEDALIEGKIRAAMELIEKHTNQVLTERDLELVLDGFPLSPEAIAIPREPVTEIKSIKYSSPADGAEIAMAPADFRWADTSPEIVRPAFGATFPSAAHEAGSVRVVFRAGYEAGLIPAGLADATKRLLCHLYESRGGADEIPAGVLQLCGPYRRILY